MRNRSQIVSHRDLRIKFADTSLKDCLSHQIKWVNFVNLTFVSGKDKHKTQLQRELTSFYERKESYKEHQITLGKRKSYSKTMMPLFNG